MEDWYGIASAPSAIRRVSVVIVKRFEDATVPSATRQNNVVGIKCF